MTTDITYRLKPTPKFRAIVRVYGGIHRAAAAWGVEYVSLWRFLRNRDAGLHSDTIATIVAKSGVPYDELFQTVGDNP